jgi:hypothetical protein
LRQHCGEFYKLFFEIGISWEVRMTLFAARIAVILAMAGFLSLQAAQAAAPEACFCLKRNSTRSTEHLGCKHKLPPNTAPEVWCINSSTGSEYPVQNLDKFDEVADGKDGCNPCIPSITPVRGEDHIRGQE